MMDKELERQYAAHSMVKYGIRSCPFCGGRAYLERKFRAFIGGETTLVSFVRCVECNARSGRVKLSDFGKTSRSCQAEKLAVENWNKRVM